MNRMVKGQRVRIGGQRRSNGRWILIAFLIGAVLNLLGDRDTALAQDEYVLGPEDVVSITVWEHPELSRTVVVRANGDMTLPPLGDVPAAGRATSVLARDLEREFYRVLRQSLQVTVSVVAFNSQKVFLAGQVGAPGRYSFERIPGLVDLLGQAGGLGPTADLSGIRIVRREGQTQRTLSVDLSHAVETGDLAGIPALQPEDVVIVPASAAAGTMGGMVGGDPIYVMGAVGMPGAVPAGGDLSLMQALSLAGGVSPNADLDEIEIIGRDTGGGSFLMRVDLEEAIESGNGGPTLRPGDAIFVSAKGGGLGTAFRATLDASRDILNLLAIRDVLRNND